MKKNFKEFNNGKSKDFTGFNHGKNPIDKRSYKEMIEMKPIEIHLKEDGSIKDEPSFAIVLTQSNCVPVIGQISLEMFNEGLKDIGYKIVKLT